MLVPKLDLSGAGSSLRRIWDTLSPLPGGRLLFARLLRLVNPYTGALGADYLELGPGLARVQLRERRAITNHVGSIHAIALINLAEVTSGLALMFGLPDDARAIPVRLAIDYEKKARGTITASCSFAPPTSNERQQVAIECALSNGSGEQVALAVAHWLVGPKPAA